MASHTVTHNTNSLGVKLRKLFENCIGQLIFHISVHIVRFIVRLLGSIYIESCTRTEVPGIILSWDAEAS